MRFIKSVFRKIHHIVIYLAGSTLRDTSGDTPGHTFRLIAKNKIGPLFFHDRLFFLAHGPSHEITSSQCIASQVPNDLHHLLLIDNAAIGGRQNGLQLRTGIDNIRFAILPSDVLGNEIHRSWAIQGDACYNVL